MFGICIASSPYALREEYQGYRRAATAGVEDHRLKLMAFFGSQ